MILTSKVEVRNAAKHPTMHRAVPHIKGLSGPHINSAQEEEPWSSAYRLALHCSEIYILCFMYYSTNFLRKTFASHLSLYHAAPHAYSLIVCKNLVNGYCKLMYIFSLEAIKSPQWKIQIK